MTSVHAIFRLRFTARQCSKVLLSILVVLGGLALTYAGSHMLAPSEWLMVATYCVAVHTSLTLVSLFLPRRLGNVVISLVTLTGFYSVYGIFLQGGIPLPGQLMVLVPLVFGLFAACELIDEYGKKVCYPACLVMVALIGLVVGLHVHSQSDENSTSSQFYDAMTKVRTDIEFRERPNIYFISFDGAIPQALLKKHLGVEPTAFHDLASREFRLFDNSFSHADQTYRSMNTLLSMGLVVPSSTDFVKSLFAGHNPSPLFSLLDRQGYTTTTTFNSGYFGGNKGPWVDNYYFEGNIDSMCLLMPSSASFFYGYCTVASLLMGRGGASASNDFVVGVVKQVAATTDAPQFVMAHVYAPRHTPVSQYNHDSATQRAEATEIYTAGLKEAGRHLEDIVRHVSEVDPTSMVLLYADHGILMLGKRYRLSDHPDLVFHDRFGIILGLRPKDACRSEFDAVYQRQDYMTTLDAIEAILRCLADVDTIWKSGGATNYTSPVYGVEDAGQRSTRYEDYLYAD